MTAELDILIVYFDCTINRLKFVKIQTLTLKKPNCIPCVPMQPNGVLQTASSACLLFFINYPGILCTVTHDVTVQHSVTHDVTVVTV